MEGQDLLTKKILALQVELGELANEWRGFKFWSKDQKPAKILYTTQGANPENAVFFKCMEDDNCGEYSYRDDYLSLLKEPEYDVCPICHEGVTYPFRAKHPILEEYVDCLHFILSIGLEQGFNKPDYEYLHEFNFGVYTDTNTVLQFIDTFQAIGGLITNGDLESYEILFLYFIGLGKHLGFTWEQVEQSYFEKNRINHERQEAGY